MASSGIATSRMLQAQTHVHWSCNCLMSTKYNVRCSGQHKQTAILHTVIIKGELIFHGVTLFTYCICETFHLYYTPVTTTNSNFQHKLCQMIFLLDCL